MREPDRNAKPSCAFDFERNSPVATAAALDFLVAESTRHRFAAPVAKLIRSELAISRAFRLPADGFIQQLASRPLRISDSARR